MANSATYNHTKIHFAEGAAPATPDAGEVVTYAKADGLMYSKDDAGVETPMSASAGIAATLFDAEGDLIIASAADTAARLARGTDGYALVSTASTVAWEAQYTTLNFIIDGGGSAITTGVKGYIEVPFAATIVAVTTLLDQSGSIVVDIWKDTYANYPPVDADSITASAPPTVSAATKATDSTLTGWTTSITANDILGFNVDSITTATRATIALRLRRT
jgi:hypothetical protein